MITNNLKITLLFSLLSVSCFAQKYITKTGQAYFMSHTDAIDIDGKNQQVGAVLNAETGDIIVIALINAFEFTLATADKHFKETYMESEIYPKAIYKGKITNMADIDLTKKGEYKAITEGDLTIHGKTNKISKEGTIVIDRETINIKCNFDVSINDYAIEVPSTVKDRVAETVDIKIDLLLNERK